MYKFTTNGIDYEMKKEGDIFIIYENGVKFAKISYCGEYYCYEYDFHVHGYDGSIHVNEFESINDLADWVVGSMS